MTLILDLFFLVAIVMFALLLIPSVPSAAQKTVQKARDVNGKIKNLRSTLTGK